MNCFGFYLRSYKRPYHVLAFVFVEVKHCPRIGQVVVVDGIKGFVDNPCFGSDEA